jgi:5'-methylthioadenosine phosphorylase
MTSATEAKLCREAEICYATMNLVTDYDVWRAEEESVSVELILENLRLNIENAKAIIKKTVASLPDQRGEKCGCGRALENCLVTQASLIPAEIKKKLHFIISKYIKP